MPSDLRLVVPRITPASNPQGRTPPSGFLTPDIFRFDSDKQPQAFTGIQKLVQQVYLEIITDTLPNGIGSGLATRLRTANEETINAIAQSGVSDVLQKIRGYQVGVDLPPDERLADLTLNSASFDELNASFALSLTLVSDAGQSFTIPLPLV